MLRQALGGRRQPADLEPEVVHVGEQARELVARRRRRHLDQELLALVLAALDVAEDHRLNSPNRWRRDFKRRYLNSENGAQVKAK